MPAVISSCAAVAVAAVAVVRVVVWGLRGPVVPAANRVYYSPATLLYLQPALFRLVAAMVPAPVLDPETWAVVAVAAEGWFLSSVLGLAATRRLLSQRPVVPAVPALAAALLALAVLLVLFIFSTVNRRSFMSLFDTLVNSDVVAALVLSGVAWLWSKFTSRKDASAARTRFAEGLIHEAFTAVEGYERRHGKIPGGEKLSKFISLLNDGWRARYGDGLPSDIEAQAREYARRESLAISPRIAEAVSGNVSVVTRDASKK